MRNNLNETYNKTLTDSPKHGRKRQKRKKKKKKKKKKALKLLHK